MFVMIGNLALIWSIFLNTIFPENVSLGFKLESKSHINKTIFFILGYDPNVLFFMLLNT